MNAFKQTLLTAILASSLAYSSISGATSMVLDIQDSPGEGLYDTTPALPVGGNNGTTVGEQRTIVFQYAADLLAEIFDSSVPIVIEARFDSLTPCSPSSGVIGSAGANGWYLNFPGAPSFFTYYPQALANSLSGSDRNAATADISATFNSDVGTAGCLTSKSYYYGLDGNAGGGIDFLSLVLHEVIHGLGFQTLVDLSTGAKPNNYNDSYMVHLEDHSLNDHWGDNTMDNSERQASAIDDGDLLWTGSNVTANIGGLTNGVANGHIQMYAPGTLNTGSSVSHFNSNTTPNELMEHVLPAGQDSIGLARSLLQDIGWPVFASNDPIISDVDSFTLKSDEVIDIIFAVMDNDTDVSSLSVTATSSNTSIIPNANLVISGSGRSKTLNIQPLFGTDGDVTVTLNVNDGSGSANTNFVVSVTTDLDPVITITSPDGAIFYDSPQTMDATATDTEDGDISASITWNSSLDGNIGSGASISPTLTDGSHLITTEVTDSGSNTSSDAISITVSLFGDADGDGLTNQFEVVTLGTNPENTDSDGDGMSDYNEISIDGDSGNYTPGVDANPLNEDTDGDGVPDGQDFDPLDAEIGIVSVNTLPQWGMMLIASLLLAIVARRKTTA